MSTIIDIAKYVNQKYKKIVVVAGKDRMEGAQNFQTLLNQQNGIDFNFDDIQFVTVARDPDSESSSDMKEFIKQDNWQAFRNDLPSSLNDQTAEQLWGDLKAALAPVPRKTPVRKTKENSDGQGSNVTWKRGMGGNGYPQTYHNTAMTGGVAEEKVKGVDGKACWDGYKYAGKEKKANGKYKDKCVKIGEDVELEMALAILKLIESQL
jgi:hypothetical protein